MSIKCNIVYCKFGWCYQITVLNFRYEKSTFIIIENTVIKYYFKALVIVLLIPSPIESLLPKRPNIGLSKPRWDTQAM